MPADLSRSWGLLFLPTDLQKSTLSEERPILFICSSPATSFVAVACHPSKLHSLTVVWLWHEITENRSTHKGLKETMRWRVRRLEKEWLLWTLLLYFVLFVSTSVLCLQEKYIPSDLFLSHCHTLIIPWVSTWFTTFFHFGVCIKHASKESICTVQVTLEIT